MWNRILGKSNDAEENPSPQTSRRKENEQPPTRKRSGSIASTSTTQKPLRGDDRNRGFHPLSTSYSSTTRSKHPDTASASIASSYATASGNQNGEPFLPPGPVRNASLVNNMPKSKVEPDDRDVAEDREDKRRRRRQRTSSLERERDRKENRASPDREEKRRGKREKKKKKGEDAVEDRGLEGPVNGFDKSAERSRGDFQDQIVEPGFAQFPGQTGTGFVGGPPSSSAPMSNHVPDQFPNQFPTGSTAPYRPPLAASEGGPGLAAEYYGDAGESVAEQPGIRPQTPSLIIGAEPHLQPASSTTAPPPEPSASGHLGAAASFFGGGSFESDTDQSAQKPSSQKPNPSSSPKYPDQNGNTHHTWSSTAIPTVAAGAAAGYYMSTQSSSRPQRPEHASSVGGGGSYTSQRPPSYAHDSYTQQSHYDQPLKPGKQNSFSSNVPLYAAGAAGLAAAEYHHNHHSNVHQSTSSQLYANGSMAQRHHHRGPLAKFVDFFKDPEGVAQFEEYTEFIGVCKDCFAPGSSPREAPRRHHFRGRRSGDRFGSSTRVDKDSRYSSSDSEKRRRRRRSWLEGGVAGYGLGKVGESLFNQNHDFDDTYSVKTGYIRKSHTASSPDRKSHASRTSSKKTSRRRSSSKDRVAMGITSDGRVYKKDSHGDIVDSFSVEKHGARRRSRSRSRSHSRDRKTGLGEAALVGALGSSIIASNDRRSDHPPDKAFVKRSRSHRERSPDHRRKTHKKEKKKTKKGFFSFSSSSSSSSEDLTTTRKHRDRKRRDSKDDHRRAELAVAGLGAAAAALALNETRRNNLSGRKSDFVAVKEPKGKHGRSSEHRKRNRRSPSHSEEDPWESASDGDESVISDLAYGDGLRKRRSNSSLSSESSGTSKWGWRWGSKKTRRADRRERRDSPEEHHPGITMHSNSSLPLQQMYPVPTADPARFDSRPMNEPPYCNITARPDPVPIQHPQPIAPVSQSVYSTQAPPEHAYTAPVGPPVFAQSSYRNQPTATAPNDNAFSAPSLYHIPGAFQENAIPTGGIFDGPPKASKPRRRDSSPAAYFAASSQPAVPRRQDSLRNVASAVRFDLPEEQIEKDRREKRRQAKADESRGKQRKEREDRSEAEVREIPGRDRRAHTERAKRNSDQTSSVETGDLVDPRGEERNEIPSSDIKGSWVAPIAAVGVASAVGAAIKARHSSSDSSSDEKARRRERRRRRQAEREAATEITEVLPEQHRRQESETSAKKDLARNKRSQSHEDYRDFFIPTELLSRAPEYKEGVADADADGVIAVHEVSNGTSKGSSVFHDSREKPAYTFGPNGEELNPYPPSPSWVPKLKLVSPTPQPNSYTDSDRGDLSPVIASKNVVESEDPEIAPPITTYEFKMDDEQTPEYTVIEPKGQHDEVFESPPNSEFGEGPSLTTWRDEITSNHVSAIDSPGAANAANDYGDDLVFAATVAAGLRDAGFDPSVVVDDPSFRRRDSPPGSEEPGTYRQAFVPSVLDLSSAMPVDNTNVPPQQGFVEGELPESGMPGAFVDEEADAQFEETQQRMSKKERKKKNKKAKRDDAFDVTEEALARGIEKEPRMESEPNLTEPEQQATSWESREDPSDIASVAASAPVYTDVGKGKKSKNKGKRGSLRFEDEASVVSAPVTREEMDRPTFDAREADQDKLAGLDRDSAEPAALQEDPAEDSFEQVKATKKKGKKSKGRRSTREAEDFFPEEQSRELDNGDIAEPLANGRSRRSSDDRSVKDSGRITQDLPAKLSTPAPIGHFPSSPTDLSLTSPEDGDDVPVTDTNVNEIQPGPHIGMAERDLSDDVQSMSFLGVGQEIPPLPNISPPIEALETKLPDSRPSSPLTTGTSTGTMSGTVSLPTSPTRRTDVQAHRLSELQKSGNTQSPVSSPSPTAIPFHFRVPPASPGMARSSPSAPPTPSAQDTYPTRPKLRPRSTEFKSSNEFRPLWLVERHASKQDPSPEGAYPSLPSSHTTSRASSVRDPDESVSDRAEFFDTSEYYTGDEGDDHTLRIDTARSYTEAGLLDSQQTTPTAADFPSSTIERHESPKQIASEEPVYPYLDYGSELTHNEEEASGHNGSPSPLLSVAKEGSSSNLKDITLGAVLGASVAGTLLAAKHYNDQSRENEDVKTAALIHETQNDQNSEMEEEQVSRATQDDSDDFMGASGDQQNNHSSIQDLPQRPGRSLEEQSFSQALESLKSPGAGEVKPLTVEQQRAIQEEDAQDAVDSWFAPESPSKVKLDKPTKLGKKKRRSIGRRTESKDASLPGTSLGQRDEETKFFAAEESAMREAIDARSKEEPPASTSEISKDLTKEMAVEEVVNVMSNVAKTTDGELDDLPSTQPKPPAVAENDWSTTPKKAKSRSGKKSRKASLIPGLGTINDPPIQGDDRPTADREVAQPLGSDLERPNNLPADESVRDVLGSQAAATMDFSSIPPEPAEEPVDYTYPIKKIKKGKKKSKLEPEPQLDITPVRETNQEALDEIQPEQADIDYVGQKHRSGTEIEANQDYAAGLVHPETIPLPIEEDPEFLDTDHSDLAQTGPNTNEIQIEQELLGLDTHESDPADVLKQADLSDRSRMEPNILHADSATQNEEPTQQNPIGEDDAPFPEPSQHAFAEDKAVDESFAFPVKKGKKSKKSKQKAVAGIDVAAEPSALESAPITAILQPADTDPEQEALSIVAGRSLDDRLELEKSGAAEDVRIDTPSLDTQPAGPTPEVLGPETIELPAGKSDPEVETIGPDEIELPPSHNLSDDLGDAGLETQEFLSESYRDEIVPASSETQQKEADSDRPTAYETEITQQSKPTDHQADKNIVAEYLDSPNEALRNASNDLPKSGPSENSSFVDAASREATADATFLNEASLDANDAAADDQSWDLPPKKKKGKKSKKNGAEPSVPASMPSERDDVPAAPVVSFATTNAANAVKDILDSSAMEESGDRAHVDRDAPESGTEVPKPVMPVISQQPIEADEWEESSRRKSKKGKKDKKAKPRDIEASEEPEAVPAVDDSSSLHASTVAATDTAKGVQDILEFETKPENPLVEDVQAEPNFIPVAEPPTERPDDIDSMEWDAPKKKKGKKGKKGPSAAAEDACQEAVESPAATAVNESSQPEVAFEALEEFTTKKSKKDKKSKKKQLIFTDNSPTDAEIAESRPNVDRELDESFVSRNDEPEAPSVLTDTSSEINRQGNEHAEEQGAMGSPAQSDTISTLEEEVALKGLLKPDPISEASAENRSQDIEPAYTEATSRPSVEQAASQVPQETWDVPDIGLVVDEPVVEPDKATLVIESLNEDVQAQASTPGESSALEPLVQSVVEEQASNIAPADLGERDGESNVDLNGSEVPVESREDMDEAKDIKTPAQDEDRTTIPSEETGLQTISGSQQGLVADQADTENAVRAETDGADFPDTTKRKKDKKDKKRGKKISSTSWDDDSTASGPQDTMPTTSDPTAEDNNARSQDPGQEPPILTEDLLDMPKSKKDEQKTKKAKALRWEDEFDTTSTLPAEDIVPKERSTEPSAIVDDFEDVPRGKKGKKKGKKVQFLAFEDDAAISPMNEESDAGTRAQEPDVSSVPENEDNHEESVQPVTTAAEKIGSDPQGPDDNRDEPANPRTVFEVGEAGLNTRDFERPESHEELVVAVDTIPIGEDANQVPKEPIDSSETTPRSKKDKKKAKKVKALSWVDETVVDDSNLDTVAQDGPKESTASAYAEMPLPKPLAEPTSGPTSEVAEDFESVPKSKKDRKKAKKSKSISWADEPENIAFGTDDIIQTEPIERVDEQHGLREEPLEESATNVPIIDDFVTATQSKKAKKKAKQSKALEWANEPESTPTPLESSEQPISEPNQDPKDEYPEMLDTVSEQVDKAAALDKPVEWEVNEADSVGAFQQPRMEQEKLAAKAEPLDSVASEIPDDFPKAEIFAQSSVEDAPFNAADDSSLERSATVERAIQPPISESTFPIAPEQTILESEPGRVPARSEVPIEKAPTGDRSPVLLENIGTALGAESPLKASPQEGLIAAEQDFFPSIPETEAKSIHDLEFDEDRIQQKEMETAAFDEKSATNEPYEGPLQQPNMLESSISPKPVFEALPVPSAPSDENAFFPNDEGAPKEAGDPEPDDVFAYSFGKGKKDKKKDKKAKAVETGKDISQLEPPSAGLDNPRSSSPSEQLVEDASKSGTPRAEQALEDNAPFENIELEPTLDTPYSLKRSKKDKKKAEKGSAADMWQEIAPSESPSSTLPQSQQALDDFTLSAQTVDEPSQSPAPMDVQNIEGEKGSESLESKSEVDASYSLKKSKKDKKKAKQAKVLDVEEEVAQSAPQVVEEPVGVPRELNEPSTDQAPDPVETSPEGIDTGLESLSEYQTEPPLDKTTASTSPEQAHKRGFFEDVGPEVPVGEEEAMEPPAKTKRTDESDPPSQKMVDMEEEAFSMPAKKSKKGKKSKKSAFSSLDMDQGEPTTLPEEAPRNQPSAGTDRDFEVGEKLGRDELDLREPASRELDQGFPTAPAETTLQDLGAPDHSTEIIAGDDAWAMPAKKSKKDKKKRKSAVRIDSEPEIVEAKTAVAETPIDELTPSIPPIEGTSTVDPSSPSGRHVEVPNLGDRASEASFYQGRPGDDGDTADKTSSGVENDSRPRSASQEAIPLGDEATPPPLKQPAEGLSSEHNEEMPAFEVLNKSKKDKKANKRQRSIPWEDDAAPTPGADPLDHPAETIIQLDPEIKEEAATFEVPQKGKKDKKEKKRQQSIAWEDDTATAPGQDNPSQPADETVQAIPQIDPDVMEDTSAFEAPKKGKKDKKSKKRQQSVAWGDDAATAPEPDQPDRLEDDIAQPFSQRDSTDKASYPGEESQAASVKARGNSKTAYSMDAYPTPGPGSPLPINRSDDYFSIPTRDQNSFPVRPFSPTEGTRQQDNYDPASQSYSRDSPSAMQEQEGEHLSSEAQGLVPSLENIDSQADYASPGRQEEEDHYNTKPHTDDLEMTAQAPAEPIARFEAVESPGPTAKTTKDKKSKKRRKAGQGADLEAEAGPEKDFGQSGPGPRDMSPIRHGVTEEESTGNKGSVAVPEALAMGGILGAGTAVAETLARKESKKRGKKDKRSKKSTWADNEEDDISIPFTPYEEAQDLQHAQGALDNGPIRSPVGRNRDLENTAAEEEYPHLERSINRDSAVHVSDSPIVSETLPIHRPLRDSGYPDTDNSPVIDSGRGEQAGASRQEATSTDPFYETPPRDRTIDVEDEDLSARRETYRDADALNISMGYADTLRDVGPGYERHQEEQSSRRTPTSEVDLPQGLETSHLPHNDLREPSPVSSTTKDRSSLLFQSSPSSREVGIDPDTQGQSPPQVQDFTEHERALSPRSPSSPSPRSRQQPHQSLFGGQLPPDTNMLSPPMSPVGRSYSPGPGLDTINEYSPEESPLHKKDRRSLSDVGSPDRGVKSRRRTGSAQRHVRSPPPAEPHGSDMLSTDDIIARMSWPEVDEEKHSIDLERSRSRPREPPSRQGVVSPSGLPAVPAEGDMRSFSGASIRSGESINAIIRTPPGSIRSSGTPPLRRSDRSVSSDLREANRVSHAKNAKSTKTRASDISDVEAAVASSSKEPSRDKGKGKVREMADVFVSQYYFPCTEHRTNQFPIGGLWRRR